MLAFGYVALLLLIVSFAEHRLDTFLLLELDESASGLLVLADPVELIERDLTSFAKSEVEVGSVGKAVNISVNIEVFGLRAVDFHALKAILFILLKFGSDA